MIIKRRFVPTKRRIIFLKRRFGQSKRRFGKSSRFVGQFSCKNWRKILSIQKFFSTFEACNTIKETNECKYYFCNWEKRIHLI